MVIFPKAKINLGLRITGKRDDGYHNLQTVFYPVGLSDALEFVVAGDGQENDRFTVSGESIDCPADKNLVLRALTLLRESFPIPVLSIHLHKRIPLGAGLGGGSSDAAFFLKALNRYFNLGLDNDKLRELALQIGSDCPFFVECIPSYAGGRGEILTPVDPVNGNYYILLVNPGIHVSTREAYEGCTPYTSKATVADNYKEDISLWKDLLVNDFEETIFLKYPAIGWIKEIMYEAGAVYSSMSGSGSTVYGLFSAKPEIPSQLRKILVWEGIL